MNFDQTIFLALHSLAGRSQMFDFAMILSGKWLIFLLAAAAICLALATKKIQNILLVAISPTIAFLLEETIHVFYHRVRPFEVLHFTYQLLEHAPGNAFPSGHATFSFAIAMATFYINRTWGTLFFVLAVIVGLGRVVAGIHWPLDIVGGAIVGVLSAMAVQWVLRKKFK